MIKHRIIYNGLINQDTVKNLDYVSIESTYRIVANVTITDFNPTLKRIITKFCKNYINTFDNYCEINDTGIKVYFTTKTCSNKYDAPDTIKGKRIAESKCKTTLYRFLTTLAIRIEQYYNDQMWYCSRDAHKFADLTEREHNHVRELDKQ